MRLPLEASRMPSTPAKRALSCAARSRHAQLGKPCLVCLGGPWLQVFADCLDMPCCLQIYWVRSDPHLPLSRIAEELLLDCDLSGLPWDLKVFQNQLVVTVHNGKTTRPSLRFFLLNDDLSEMTGSQRGYHSRTLLCDHFRQPNMFLLGSF